MEDRQIYTPTLYSEAVIQNDMYEEEIQTLVQFNNHQSVKQGTFISQSGNNCFSHQCDSTSLAGEWKDQMEHQHLPVGILKALW